MTWLIPAVYLLFLLLLLHRYTHRTPHLRSYPPRTTGALVSVIIPARNEAENIETCIRSVLASTYEPIEIIVVDDRSSDGTAAIVEQVASQPGSPRPGATGARSRAARRGGSASRGRWSRDGAWRPERSCCSPTPTRGTTRS